MKIKNAAEVSFLYLFLTFSGFAFPVLSQRVIYVPESETAFKKAVTQYARDNFNEALVAFEALSNSQQIHHRMTAALLMTGKSLYKLGRYADAIPYFDKLVGMFPNSKYVDAALYTRAAANYRLNKSQVAVKDLFLVLDSSEENALKAKSKKL